VSEQALRIIEGSAKDFLWRGAAGFCRHLLPPPSLYSASYLLSMITASLAVDLTWLPVEICVKE
jgi:hypothetical protein